MRVQRLRWVCALAMVSSAAAGCEVPDEELPGDEALDAQVDSRVLYGRTIDFSPTKEWAIDELADGEGLTWRTEVVAVDDDAVVAQGDLVWIDIDTYKTVHVALAPGSLPMVFRVLVDYGADDVERIPLLCQYQTIGDRNIVLERYDWFSDVALQFPISFGNDTMRDNQRENSLFLHSRAESYDEVFSLRLDNCNLLGEAETRPVRAIGVYGLPLASGADVSSDLVGAYEYQGLRIAAESR